MPKDWTSILTNMSLQVGPFRKYLHCGTSFLENTPKNNKKKLNKFKLGKSLAKKEMETQNFTAACRFNRH